MVIDQRNAGASVTNAPYSLDRWQGLSSTSDKFSVQQNAGAVTPPTGFTNYLGVTSLSAYTPAATTESYAVAQSIEGFNAADFAWGTANASTVCLSFWVRSSLTGTFGGSIRNSGNSRSYPYSYTISAANTWEYKTVTIAGDTTGTWLTTNGIGINVVFGLGAGSDRRGTAGVWAATNLTNATGATSVVGTNGATFYITGVQLEVGTQATSFEYRQYGTELALCQRYYQIVALNIYNGNPGAGEFHAVPVAYLTQMRATPTAGTISGGTSNNIDFTGLESLTPYGCRFTISSNTSADSGYVGGQAPLSAEL
jgi:hypothetical protein